MDFKLFIPVRFSSMYCVVAIVVAISFLNPMNSSATDLKDYKIKAAYIYNFMQFVRWENHSTKSKSEFIIEVIGDNDFAEVLRNSLVGKKILDKTFRVIEYPNLETAQIEQNNVNVVYISSEYAVDIDAIHNISKEKNLLTISDKPNFAKNGGIIGFVNKEDRIVFQINNITAKEAGVVLSSKLLRLAEIVND